jgi:hypothetical protein
MMPNLYLAHCANLMDYNTTKADLIRWASIFKLISPGINLVDRCNSIVMPYRFKTFDTFAMPRDLNNFSLTYEECCLTRALELVYHSRRIDKPITIMYSGGIDSTCVLVAFMKILDAQELRERIQVALSIESIDENPNFYYDHIRSKCTIIPSENMGSFFDRSCILVSGEHNDQLFGSDIIGSIYRFGEYSQIHQPYSRSFITHWLRHNGMNESDSNYWYNLLDHHIRHQAPGEVTTNFHFFWWYNFCFKWQNVYFRMLAPVDPDKRSQIDRNFLDDYYLPFFTAVNFQKWSMLNHHLKLGADWSSYKIECKKFIFDYNGDADYRDYKIKIGSLYQLSDTKKGGAAVAITDNLDFLNTVWGEDFYEPNNTFV